MCHHLELQTWRCPAIQKRPHKPYFIQDKVVIHNLYSLKGILKHEWNLTDFNTMQDMTYDQIQDLCRFIIFYLTKSLNSPYLYGLSSKIFKSDFDYQKELTYLFVSYYTDHKYHVSRSIFNYSYMEQHMLENFHRSGWYYITSKLIEEFEKYTTDQSKKILTDFFIDRTFGDESHYFKQLNIIPYTRPWIGFCHHTPISFNNSTTDMIENPSFKLSLKSCLGIFVFSDYMKSWFESKNLNISVHRLYHPIELNVPLWQSKNFLLPTGTCCSSNKQTRKLVQIGGWLRNPFAIYAIHAFRFHKIHLKGKDMDNYFPKNQILNPLNSMDIKTVIVTETETETETEITHGCRNGMNIYEIYKAKHEKTLLNNDIDYQPVEIMQTLSNQDYDQLLTNSVVFIRLIDASACNTLIECIVRNCPIVINRLPAVVEYLGDDYPLYFDDEINSDISDLLSDQKIMEASLYLSKLPKHRYKMENFITDFINSDIIVECIKITKK